MKFAKAELCHCRTSPSVRLGKIGLLVQRTVSSLSRLPPQAESELQRATMDAARTTRQLEETIDEFERHKIQDIKVFVVIVN